MCFDKLNLHESVIEHSKVAPKLAIPWEKGPAAKFPLTHDDAFNKQFHADPLVRHSNCSSLLLPDGLRPRNSPSPEFSIEDYV